VGVLYLIRHGQASYGEVDYDRLSARGIEQARAVGGWLRGTPLDAIYAGPLVRQRQTIEHAREVAETAPAPTTVDELAEYPAFHMLQHLVPRLVAEDPKFAALTSAPSPRLLDEAFHAVLSRWSRDEWFVDGLERITEFATRVRAGLGRIIGAAASGARVAAVTSAGPIGVAVGLALDLAPEKMIATSTVIRNASITELRFRSADFAWRPGQLSLVTLNTTGHLPAELQTER
jgi:broad specificity phosphatase PhoE